MEDMKWLEERLAIENSVELYNNETYKPKARRGLSAFGSQPGGLFEEGFTARKVGVLVLFLGFVELKSRS